MPTPVVQTSAVLDHLLPVAHRAYAIPGVDELVAVGTCRPLSHVAKAPTSRGTGSEMEQKVAVAKGIRTKSINKNNPLRMKRLMGAGMCGVGVCEFTITGACSWLAHACDGVQVCE